mgnify:CR=1 FL=1
MKKLVLIALVLAVAGAAGIAGPIVTENSVDCSQPKVNATGTVVYHLAANKACTTKSYYVAPMGGFSYAFFDSVAGQDSVAIIKIKCQIAWVDIPAAYSATGVTDSLSPDADTLTGGATAALRVKWSRGWDISQHIPRSVYIRYIITNTGNAKAWLKFFPLHNQSTP